MLGIDLQESSSKVKSWAQSKGLTYRILLDTQDTVFTKYSMGYIPHNVVLDQNMVVCYTNYGYEERKIIGVIDSLLVVAGVAKGEETNSSPGEFVLKQNYPNPFNATTTIEYTLPAPARVVLRIYDQRGRLVRTLVDGFETGGSKRIRWDGTNDRAQKVSSGVYIYSLQVGAERRFGKMILLQ